MKATVHINGDKIELTATAAPDAVYRKGYAVWVDTQGYVYCEAGNEGSSPYDITLSEQDSARLRIGQQIRARRESSGLTVEQFATLAGIKPTTAISIEQGRFTMAADKLDAMLQHIGCQLTVAPL